MFKATPLAILLVLSFAGKTQIPATKLEIKHFIDSIGTSNDFESKEASRFPAFANGKNYLWKIKFLYNKNRQLLWVEEIKPDSISTVYFYCKDSLIFVSEYPHFKGSKIKEEEAVFRNIYIFQSKIIDDDLPGLTNRPLSWYLEESKKWLDQSKIPGN